MVTNRVVGDKKMDVKIIDSLNYEEAAKVLVDSYVPQWGVAGTPVWNAGYVEHLDKTFIKPYNGPYVGAYDGDKLVGVGMCAMSNWNVTDLGEVKTALICNLGVLPDYQRKGLATKMVNELMNAVAGKVDVAYRICNESIVDFKVLEKCGFEKKINNAFQMGSSEELGESIIGLMSDKTGIQEVGSRARKYVCENKSWEIMVNRILDCFNDAIKESL